MRFKIGQEVTPVKTEWNVVYGKMETGDYPEFGKIYTVAGYPLHGKDHVPEYHQGMMQLAEKPDNKVYHESSFEAMVPSEQLSKDLEEVLKLELVN